MSSPDELSDYPKRKRIVIPIEAPESASNKAEGTRRQPKVAKKRSAGGGRLGKILAVIFIVIVFVVSGLAAGCYVWWQSYKQKPAYSLALIVDAAQRNDMKTFDSMVETDKIVDNLVPQVTDKITAQYGSVLPSNMRKQMDTAIPKVLPAVKQRVHDEVAGQVKELSARAEGKPFFAVAVAMPWMVTIVQDGNNAKASLSIKDRQIELTMQHIGDVWHIVAVKDDQFVQKTIDSIVHELTLNGIQNTRDNKKQSGKGNQLEIPRIPFLGNGDGNDNNDNR